MVSPDAAKPVKPPVNNASPAAIAPPYAPPDAMVPAIAPIFSIGILFHNRCVSLYLGFLGSLGNCGIIS